MTLELVREKWSGRINEVTIGAGKADGGTRTAAVKVGGETTLPFLFDEGQVPNKPVVAMEILDSKPEGWPECLLEQFGDAVASPAAWAKACVEKYGAELICLRLQGLHPDFGNSPPEEAAKTVKAVLGAVGVPLIVLGCGNSEKDNAAFPQCSEAAKGERILIGEAVQDNYKTLTASCLADGHNIIGMSPIDINIAKQVNILIADMGFPAERLVINPTTGALGYGMEYGYSIMERARLAALNGDKMLSMPMICYVGQESWRAKEAKSLSSENPAWGDEKKRGPMWEIITATSMLNAGADIVVLRHPESVAAVKEEINRLMSAK